MERLVPAFILEQYAAGERSGRFDAAVLFVDLSGFSVVTEALMAHGQHGAEVLAMTMGAVFEPLVQAVYRHRGFVTGFAGDGLTAIFAGEVPACAHRALAAACQIRQRMIRQPAFATPYGSFNLSVKAGLALGDAGWGIVTAADGQRASYYFEGTAVDGAAAAEQQAEAGEIILDAALAQTVAGEVTLARAGNYFRVGENPRSLPSPQPYLPGPLDPQLLARFVDPAVTQQRARGEFRQVVNLLVSLPTVRTASQLAIFAQTVFTLQERYGGLLNRLEFGDKGAHLVLFWGAPVAHENDVERALNFILDLQARTAIPLNAGVTYEIAHAGYIGSEWRSEYTCYGRGINLAARFMTSGPRGEIWVDENVVRRAGEHFSFAYEGEMTFKGFGQAQPVYTLLERKESSDRFFEGNLVGREQELRQLFAFVQPLFQGTSPGLLLLWGDAGIGKSRLLHAFYESTSGERSDILWALCQTDEIVRESLNPFRYWLRHYFDISASLSERRNKRSFNRQLDALIMDTADPLLAAELDATRSFLGALVELRWPDSLYEQLDAQARYENTLSGLTALFRAEAARRPVIILLEDAHWLDEDTKMFLPRLLQAVAPGQRSDDHSYPLALLATARPEEDAPPLAALAAAEIRLGQLAEAEVARLVEALLQGPAADQMLKLVAERAEGNPFFAEQMVHYLRQEGLLQATDAGWGVAQTQQRTPLPVDVRAVLVARLDQLPQELREAVETASVLGREFDVRLLARVVADAESLPAMVNLGEKAGIWSRRGEQRYLFKHALLRDTAYRTQIRARRQALHARATAALESLYRGELSSHYGELAYHSERGMLVQKARSYLQLAGDSASAGYQNALALDYYRRALALTPETDQESGYHLYLAQEAIFRLLGKKEERQQVLALLSALAQALADPAKQAAVALRRAIGHYDAAEYAQTVRLTEEAATAAAAVAATALVVEADVYRAMALMRLGQLDQAARLAERGRGLARTIDNFRAEAQFLNLLGMIALQQEAYVEADKYFGESLACARAAGERRMQALPLNNLGLLAGHHGDYAGAQGYYEQALVIAREIGERAGEGLVLGNLGWIAAVTGERDKARTYYEHALRINREAGDRLGETYSLINLSACWGAMDNGREARRYGQEALQLARETGERSAEAWALTYLAHCRLASGQTGAAAEAYRAALSIREELQQPALATEPAAGLAAAHLAAGDTTAAMTCVEKLLPQLDGSMLEGTDDPLRVYHTAYRVLQAAGDPRADTVLRQAYEVLQARAGRIKDEALRHAFVERNPSHHALAEAWQQAFLGEPDEG